jgi:hypothetical protein
MTAKERPAGRKQAKQARDLWQREQRQLATDLQQRAQRHAVPINDAEPLPKIN